MQPPSLYQKNVQASFLLDGTTSEDVEILYILSTVFADCFVYFVMWASLIQVALATIFFAHNSFASYVQPWRSMLNLHTDDSDRITFIQQ